MPSAGFPSEAASPYRTTPNSPSPPARLFSQGGLVHAQGSAGPFRWSSLGSFRCPRERAAGTGAAMRIAPLAFLLDPLDPEQRVTLRDVCRITHHSD